MYQWTNPLIKLVPWGPKYFSTVPLAGYQAFNTWSFGATSDPNQKQTVFASHLSCCPCLNSRHNVRTPLPFPESMSTTPVLVSWTQCIRITALGATQPGEWHHHSSPLQTVSLWSAAPQKVDPNCLQQHSPVTLTFAGIAVSTFSWSPWQVMVEIHAQLTVQTFGVVPAHAVSMNLGSYKPGEATSETHKCPHFFHSQQKISSFKHISSSSKWELLNAFFPQLSKFYPLSWSSLFLQ